MKIAFDECVPSPMVRVFKSLSNERQIRKLYGGVQFVIESAMDYTPAKDDADYSAKNDVPWLRRFAAAGGKVVISGNTAMQNVPHEREALKELGFITIFFEAKWNGLSFFQKSALLLHWWPVVITELKTTSPGTFLAIPRDWSLNGKLRTLNHENGTLSKTNPKATSRRPASKLKRVETSTAEVKPLPQTSFDFSQGIGNVKTKTS